MRKLIARKYELLEEIGPGAGGSTCRVRDTVLGSNLTVTVRSEQIAGDPELLARLERRVQQACELRHQHIVQVLGLAREGKKRRVVEASVDGEPLDQVLRERRALPPMDALHIARQLADALAYAHDQGVIHGGLTPASVLIQDTVPPRAMLAAFGSAGLDSGPGAVPPILLPYAAPERLTGVDVDVRIDVFALGLVLFEMLEGKRFFAGADDSELTNLLRDGSGPLLPQFSSILPPGVSALVARMIRRSPAKRQQTMAQVRSEIDACLPRVPSSAPAARTSKAPPASPAARGRTAAPREAKKRVMVQMPAVETDEPSHEPTPDPTPDPILVRRVLTRASAPHRRTPAAGVALVAAVIVALGWPIVRSVGMAPAASARLSSTPAAPARPREPVAAKPALVDEERHPARAEAAAAPVTLLPDVGAAPESSVPAVADAAYAGQRDDVPTPRAAETSADLASSKLCPPPNVAPRIVSYQPHRRDSVSVMEGAPVAFRVQATDPDVSDPVTYAWFLDGRKVGGQPSWRFVAPLVATAAAHTVEVRVSDGDGAKAPPVTWHVEVTPRMTETNVRDWLGRLAGAWERKDVSTLRIYGIVTTDAEADALRKQLARSDAYRVSIANDAIRTHGNHATVAFDRTEVDKRGRVVSSRRESYELEKQPNGFIGLRPPAAASR